MIVELYETNQIIDARSQRFIDLVQDSKLEFLECSSVFRTPKCNLDELCRKIQFQWTKT